MFKATKSNQYDCVFLQEIAKRMQEEEKQRNRRRMREQEGHTEGTVSGISITFIDSMLLQQSF